METPLSATGENFFTPSPPAEVALEQSLRQRAEARFKASQPPAQAGLSLENTQLVLHELRLRQIELEMQNEDLRQTQAELEVARARYFDLYDQAPVGYIQLSEKGLVLEANLTAAGLLGVERSALVKQPLSRFIVPEDQAIYYQYDHHFFNTGAPQSCELRLAHAGGALFWAQLEMTVGAPARRCAA